MLIKKFILLLTSLSFLFAVPLQIGAKDEIEIVNNVGMGNVSIALINQQKNEKGEVVPWVQNQVVVPGETISHITRIKNEGEPAWIRARVVFDTASKVNLFEKDVHFIDGWEKKSDGYFYWTKEVKKDEIVDFIDSITIPESWNSVQVSKTPFHIKLQADAVQTKNFTPDFKSEQPWFGTLIETSLYNYTRSDTHTDIKYWVTYLGGAEGMFAKGGDFFSNWTTIMPGDTLKDSSLVSNSYSQPIKLYFRTENSMPTELGEKLILKIFRGTEVVYAGPLTGTLKEINIANLQPNEQFILNYELSVPSELNNKYDLAEAQTRWIFRAELAPNPVNTGPADSPLGYITSSIISILAIAYLLKKRKGEDYAIKGIK